MIIFSRALVWVVGGNRFSTDLIFHTERLVSFTMSYSNQMSYFYSVQFYPTQSIRTVYFS